MERAAQRQLLAAHGDHEFGAGSRQGEQALERAQQRPRGIAGHGLGLEPEARSPLRSAIREGNHSQLSPSGPMKPSTGVLPPSHATTVRVVPKSIPSRMGAPCHRVARGRPFSSPGGPVREPGISCLVLPELALVRLEDALPEGQRGFVEALVLAKGEAVAIALLVVLGTLGLR